MKPWFNTALILMILIINAIFGYQIHKRITNTEIRMSMMEMNQQQGMIRHEDKYNHRYNKKE